MVLAKPGPAMADPRIIDVQLDERTILWRSADVEQERRIAIFDLLEDNSFLIENIDATIIAQAPKMRPYIDTMRENIARVLQIEVSQVKVKATTEEGLGFTGTGEGISSQAVCLLNTPYGLYSSDVNAGCAGCGGCPKNGIQ